MLISLIVVTKPVNEEHCIFNASFYCLPGFNITSYIFHTETLFLFFFLFLSYYSKALNWGSQTGSRVLRGSELHGTSAYKFICKKMVHRFLRNVK